MNGIVSLVAPRGPADFMVRTLVLLALIGAANYLRDIIEHRNEADSLVNNVIEASFVALPFSVFALALIRHMKQLQDQLVGMATTDLLTGLPNRRDFLTRIEAHLPQPGGALMMIDVDRFKQVNDRFGHAAGDVCLQHLSILLRGLVQPGDLLARLGGEEFAVFLPDADPDRAHRVGQGIAAGITLSLRQGGAPSHVTASVGLVWTAGQAEVSQLLGLADRALYRAKAEGRARLVEHAGPLLPDPHGHAVPA